MKKFVGIIILLIMVMTIYPASALTHWEAIEAQNLLDDEIEWVKKNNYEKYSDIGIDEYGLVYGCGVITEDDSVFFDAKPDTIIKYSDKIGEFLSTDVHSIEIIDMNAGGAYRIYRLIIKWNTPIQFSIYENCYGMDCFVRFYN